MFMFEYIYARVLLQAVTHHSGTRARVSESKQRVSEHSFVVSHCVAASLAATLSPMTLTATRQSSVGTTRKFAKLAPFK